MTLRSKDDASVTKNPEKHFGYKAHTLVKEMEIIEKLVVRPANIQYARNDLCFPRFVF